MWLDLRDASGKPIAKGGVVMIKEIEIKDQAQVQKINRLASSAPYDVWLHSETVMLDARSLLGLYALIGKRVRVVAEDNVDPKQFGKLVDRME